MAQHAAVIAVSLGPTAARMQAALPEPDDGLSRHICDALSGTEQLGEPFFWPRLSHHASVGSGELTRALAAVLHPL